MRTMCDRVTDSSRTNRLATNESFVAICSCYCCPLLVSRSEPTETNNKSLKDTHFMDLVEKHQIATKQVYDVVTRDDLIRISLCIMHIITIRRARSSDEPAP